MIKLQTILRSKQSADNTDPSLWSTEEVHSAMREAIRQALDLAANEIEVEDQQGRRIPKAEAYRKYIFDIINKVS